MTPPLTHEINYTVAEFAAERKKLYSTVAERPGVELQPQGASRSLLRDAGSTCFTSMQSMGDSRESNDVLAGQHTTGDKGRQMVWLEVRNDRAHVMVDKAQYNDWKEKHSMEDVERSQHGLQRGLP
jgi:hypothetical protein